jgi:hypothetical protein
MFAGAVVAALNLARYVVQRLLVQRRKEWDVTEFAW